MDERMEAKDDAFRENARERETVRKSNQEALRYRDKVSKRGDDGETENQRIETEKQAQSDRHKQTDR